MINFKLQELAQHTITDEQKADLKALLLERTDLSKTEIERRLEKGVITFINNNEGYEDFRKCWNGGANIPGGAAKAWEQLITIDRFKIDFFI